MRSIVTAVVSATLFLWAPGLSLVGSARADDPVPSNCDLPVELMAVVHSARHPRRSLAMVSYGRGKGRMVGVGSRIADRTVALIEPRVIWLRLGDDLCSIRLSHEGKRRPKPTTPPKKKRAKRPRPKR